VNDAIQGQLATALVSSFHSRRIAAPKAFQHQIPCLLGSADLTTQAENRIVGGKRRPKNENIQGPKSGENVKQTGVPC